jgi:hypothetical protein
MCGWHRNLFNPRRESMAGNRQTDGSCSWLQEARRYWRQA